MPTSLAFRIALCLAWLFAAAAGLFAVAKYARTPGEGSGSPRRWPADSGIPMDSARPTLLMFAHPKCSCSRASLAELNRLLAHCQGRVSVRIEFYVPAKDRSGWTETDLWQAAAAIPGVAVDADADGRRAKLFGAQTSGHVALYDTRGALLFSGGITSERGHAGDNAGESAIVALLSGQKPSAERTPVFGCSLLDRRTPDLSGRPLCLKP
jgi:hypothetical protein